MKEYPKVSVIILNAFSTNNLKECLESVEKTEYSNFEVIVVDCLTPGIRDFININFHWLQLISLDRDIGPSAMHNVGIKKVDPHAKYVVFLDNDTVVDKNWLGELVSCMEMGSDIGGGQAKILLYDNPTVLNTNGNKANYLAIGWPDGYGSMDSDDDMIREISFPSGAAMILRKDVLEKTGMFDVDYFIYADDLDIGLRINLAGYKVIYCPKSIVYHKYKFLKGRRNFYYLNRNRIQTFLKLYKTRTYFLLIPAILMYEVFVLGYAVLNGFVKELLKVYVDIIKNMNKIRQKRSEVRKYKVISDKELITRLEGAINFSEISDNLTVKYLLNPFLDGYKKLLIRNWRRKV
ncbi:MAG: glycosyltransferase family 2 protein [Halobacteriota archaeon]